jgi:hypothetical protein
MAVNFGNNDGVDPGVEAAQLASAAMVTQPMNEEKIPNTRPVIKANLASMGEVELIRWRCGSADLALYRPDTTRKRSWYLTNSLRIWFQNVHGYSIGEGQESGDTVEFHGGSFSRHKQAAAQGG